MEFVKRGAYVGLNGIITFGDRKTKNMTTSSIALAKEGDKTGNMKKVVETVPLERIVLETDSPYLTPIPHRGKRNEPSFVKFVAERVAEIKGISLEEVEKTTTQNAKLLFKI
jgi:TatD DNase family protein